MLWLLGPDFSAGQWLLAAGFLSLGQESFRLCSCTLAGGACCTTAGCGAGGGVLAVFPPQLKMAAIRAAKMDRR